MDDREVEALLYKYRPAGAPAGLRARINNSIHASSHPLIWPWLAAAAALLAIAIVLHGTATGPTLQTPGPTASQLADGFGGGEDGLAIAEFILSSPTTADRRVTEAPWSSPQ